MIVMTANNSGKVFRALAGEYPKNVGWLLSPGGFRVPPIELPFALDNGAFSAFKNNREWDESSFWALLDKCKAKGLDPRFVVVPDAVGDAVATRRLWDDYAIRVRRYGFPLAFAVQDGMAKDDVPPFVDVVFIGGSTRWKWLTARQWCKDFPRVHIARVNTRRQLLYCKHIGAESTDGTGWFRGCQKRLAGLIRFLREET